MPLPNADWAYVPPEKLRGYLLDKQHPIGGSKAKFFRALGYDQGEPAILERDLVKLVQTSDEIVAKTSAFGEKYVVSGTIAAPNGLQANVTTVWIVESSDPRPRLVTAYPGEKT